MLRIALTGGIATGKSYVLAGFRRTGVPCLDADQLAHGIMAAGTEATEAIGARFGSASIKSRHIAPVKFKVPSDLRCRNLLPTSTRASPTR